MLKSISTIEFQQITPPSSTHRRTPDSVIPRAMAHAAAVQSYRNYKTIHRVFGNGVAERYYAPPGRLGSGRLETRHQTESLREQGAAMTSPHRSNRTLKTQNRRPLRRYTSR